MAIKEEDDLLIDEVGTEQRPFGPEEEEGIIALALEMPEFYTGVGKYISHEYFSRFDTKIVGAIIERYLTKYGVVPTRKLVRDQVLKELTADDDYKSILKLIERRPNPREVPIIKDTILEWARHRAFGLLYGEQALSAYEGRDYETLEKILEEARRITDVTASGLDFFRNAAELFDEEVETHLTCGYPRLDRFINMGGATRKEVFIWMAPTNVGKSIVLVNSGVACVRLGLNVLHITLEMSKQKTGHRYLGVVTGVKIKQRKEKRGEMEAKIAKFAASFGGGLKIYEYAPDEISVDTLMQLVDMLRKTENWNPDVLVIDYLECMISKVAADNKDDYLKQKRVSTQIRGLAKNLNALIFSATQTNRGDTGKGGKANPNAGQAIDMNRVAESFGKMMPVDYVVSINQTPEEYKSTPPRMRFYIAKNRNGPKNQQITATVDYDTMAVREEDVPKGI